VHQVGFPYTDVSRYMVKKKKKKKSGTNNFQTSEHLWYSTSFNQADMKYKIKLLTNVDNPKFGRKIPFIFHVLFYCGNTVPCLIQSVLLLLMFY